MSKLAGNILIVDDSAIMRRVERNVLHGLGYANVVEASNGLEALERALAPGENVRLVLLDWNMPMLDGIQFLAGLMTHPSGRDIPVIMVSAESNRERILEAMCAGIKSYVIKPFHPNELRVKIEEAMRVHALGTRPARLSGALAEVGFPAVVQLAATAALTGRIAVRRGAVPLAEIGLRCGEVTHCTFLGRAGDEAFLALACERDGTFELDTRGPELPPNLTRPSLILLLEAMRRQDEMLRAS